MFRNKFNLRNVVAIAICLAGFGFSANAQNVVIQTNEVGKSPAQEDCAYRINGICTTEDIGGVEATGTPHHSNYQMCAWGLVFENYNNFTVSVIFEVNKGRTGTIVLRSNERKETTDKTYCKPESIRLIARKLN